MVFQSHPGLTLFPGAEVRPDISGPDGALWRLWWAAPGQGVPPRVIHSFTQGLAVSMNDSDLSCASSTDGSENRAEVQKAGMGKGFSHDKLLLTSFLVGSRGVSQQGNKLQLLLF